jgi:hypothetical protein
MHHFSGNGFGLILLIVLFVWALSSSGKSSQS